VKGVTVQLRVTPQLRVHDIKAKVEATFRRHALADARSVRVSVMDGIVTLEGQVHNWQEWHNAEAAAWAGGGVVSVKNRLFVSP
jgi:osmotically-inducible protein OsmY